MSLKENVFLTHAGDGRNDSRIRGVVDGIEHMQSTFLMFGKLPHFDEVWQRSFRKSMGIDIAAIRPQGNKPVGMLQAEMPGSRCSHGHSSQHDSVTINCIATTDIVDRFEHIRLTSPSVTILYATQGMKFQIRLIWR